MEVLQSIENGVRVITITIPSNENVVIAKDRHQVLVRHKRTLEEASLDVRRHLKRNLSDKEIDQLVRKVRQELWGE
jgi:hypothetical protein